jgi:hypothetical protein
MPFAIKRDLGKLVAENCVAFYVAGKILAFRLLEVILLSSYKRGCVYRDIATL